MSFLLVLVTPRYGRFEVYYEFSKTQGQNLLTLSLSDCSVFVWCTVHTHVLYDMKQNQLREEQRAIYNLCATSLAKNRELFKILGATY